MVHVYDQTWSVTGIITVKMDQMKLIVVSNYSGTSTVHFVLDKRYLADLMVHVATCLYNYYTNTYNYVKNTLFLENVEKLTTNCTIFHVSQSNLYGYSV